MREVGDAAVEARAHMPPQVGAGRDELAVHRPVHVGGERDAVARVVVTGLSERVDVRGLDHRLAAGQQDAQAGAQPALVTAHLGAALHHGIEILEAAAEPVLRDGVGERVARRRVLQQRVKRRVERGAGDVLGDSPWLRAVLIAAATAVALPLTTPR